MAGSIEEGEEVIREGKRKEQTAADLALIGAAQRVGRCEIAAYTTARNLAVQMRDPDAGAVADASLGEEQERLPVARSAGAAASFSGADACGG